METRVIQHWKAVSWLIFVNLSLIIKQDLMDATTLEALKSEWRRLITTGIGEAIADLKKHLPDFSPHYNALLLIEGRLNDANLKSIQNLLSDDALQIEYNQIRADLLLLVSSLAVRDFALPQGATGPKTGSLLYKIPRQMQLQQKTKCIVRLAFDQADIIRNIELGSDVRIQSVRVAEVMQVELIDPSAAKPFEIFTVSDEEQFLETDDYTEWIFYVKPILEGAFPLVLKISVVEIVQGRERVRNITWEETINIQASAPAEADSAFRSTGISVSPVPDAADFPLPDMIDMVEHAVHSDSPPLTPQRAVVPPPAEKVVPLPQKRRSNRTWMAAAASILLVVTVAIFIRPSSVGNETKHLLEEEIPQPAPVIVPNQPSVVPLDSLLQQDTLYEAPEQE